MSFFLFLAALILSASLTFAAKKYAVTFGLVDKPNGRSSHQTPTPRGGGIAIVFAFLLTSVVAFLLQPTIDLPIFLAFFGSGLGIAVIGFIDDHRHIPAGMRLGFQVIAVVWGMSWIGGVPPVMIGAEVYDLGWAGHILGAFALLWLINLYNFMDGIDGIASLEALFVTLIGGLIISLDGATGLSNLSFLLFASVAGFLFYNFPPAKIFMGDVGSCFIGLLIGLVAIASLHVNPGLLWVWGIGLGVFLVDATFTLVRRTIQRKVLHTAHRQHAYQILTRKYQSHLKVDLEVCAINFVWLLPLAFMAWLYPALGWLFFLAAVTPLILICIILKAGTEENQ